MPPILTKVKVVAELVGIFVCNMSGAPFYGEPVRHYGDPSDPMAPVRGPRQDAVHNKHSRSGGRAHLLLGRKMSVTRSIPPLETGRQPI